MTPQQALQLAGVPEARHAEALASIARAKDAKRGLLAHKLKARWLHAGDIAGALAWGDERLCTVRPDLARWDIAPMLNVTAHGDNGPWAPDGSRPLANYWRNADPESADYQSAVEANYWLKGTHPRSKASRKDSRKASRKDSRKDSSSPRDHCRDCFMGRCFAEQCHVLPQRSQSPQN